MKVEKTEYYYYCDVCGTQMDVIVADLSKIEAIVSYPGNESRCVTVYVCPHCQRRMNMDYGTFREALVSGLKDKASQAYVAQEDK
mgnify:CR=1 FL=1